MNLEISDIDSLSLKPKLSPSEIWASLLYDLILFSSIGTFAGYCCLNTVHLHVRLSKYDISSPFGYFPGHLHL